jgi:hypothetical protein
LAVTDLLSGLADQTGDDVKCLVCGVEPCGCGIDFARAPRHSQILPMVEGEPGTLAAPAARFTHAAPFAARREELAERHGPRSAAAGDLPVFLLAGNMLERAQAVRERLSGPRLPDAELAAIALRTLETMGAIALTLHERLTAIVAGQGRAAE